ncbi:hypothetical protein IFM89_012791 [Coptis chinensis]|uniref:Uncharacterized protein n=1 Tax=Coptis chinensis TaxID=261450 RepID=A0A835H4T3_9MAGN|nr:hypothetical protein IFM89_012791 [Coptis chinensis]
MFLEVKVPVEILTDNVLRCHAPLHASGRVPFYVICSNRLACTEVREFEFYEKLSAKSSLAVVISEPDDEMRIQIRFAKMLCLGMNWKRLDCFVEECDNCHLKDELFSAQKEDEKEWERKNPHILNDEGQGVIHLAVALGNEWAMGRIIAAGVSPNFKDAQGRTALHWPAYYGREETVDALYRCTGKSKIEISQSVAATIAAEKAVESVEELSVVPPDGGDEWELSLKGSLAAVRKAGQAAFLIQTSLHARLFHYRLWGESSDEVFGIPPNLVVLASLGSKTRKMGHFRYYLHGPAENSVIISIIDCGVKVVMKFSEFLLT